MKFNDKLLPGVVRISQFTRTSGDFSRPASVRASIGTFEQAQAMASDLEDFNWNEFSDVGILCPPEGICPVGSLPIVEEKSVTEEALERWVPLVER